jgi:hypothetical protein
LIKIGINIFSLLIINIKLIKVTSNTFLKLNGYYQ